MLTVEKSSDSITPSLARKLRELQKVPKEAYNVFKTATPKRSGNAQNKTVLQGTVINANYPYAKRLDKGYSKMAPVGMTLPTVKYIRDRLNKLFRGK